jgi:hypothetical protein
LRWTKGGWRKRMAGIAGRIDKIQFEFGIEERMKETDGEQMKVLKV